jgi:hypothetical protein
VLCVLCVKGGWGDDHEIWRLHKKREKYAENVKKERVGDKAIKERTGLKSGFRCRDAIVG